MIKKDIGVNIKKNKMKIIILSIISFLIYYSIEINIIERSYEHYLINESGKVFSEESRHFEPFKLKEIKSNLNNQVLKEKIVKHIEEGKASISINSSSKNYDYLLKKKNTPDIYGTGKSRGFVTLEKNKFLNPKLLLIPQKEKILLIESNINKPLNYKEIPEVKLENNFIYVEDKIIELKNLKFKKIYFEDWKFVYEQEYKTNIDYIKIIKKTYYSFINREKNLCKNKDLYKYYKNIKLREYKPSNAMELSPKPSKLNKYGYCDDFKIIEYKEEFELKIEK